ncbi:MAG: glycosyltransferase family 4 protein [Planctomycetota bacterium]
MSALRALILKSNDYPVAGAVRLVEMYVAHLDRARVEPVLCHIVSPDREPTLTQVSPRMEGIENHEIVWKGLRQARATGAELRQIIQKAGIDVVTSNDMRTDLTARLAGGSKGMGVPWTAFVHGWIGFKRTMADMRYGFYELANRWAVRAADEIWTGSHACGRDARKMLPKKMPLRICMNAVEPYYLQTQPGEAQALRQSLGLPDDALLTGTLGRMAWAKGHHLLAQAVIESGCDNLYGVLLGYGEEEEKLRDMISKPPFKGRIFMPGKKASIDQMPAYLEAFDFFCFSSIQESLPVSVLEAMYQDNAVICPKTGDLPLVLEDGKHGLLYPPGDVPAMAACLRRYVEDVELRETMRKAAKDRVLAQFCAPRYSKDCENGWVDIVERMSGTRAALRTA